MLQIWTAMVGAYAQSGSIGSTKVGDVVTWNVMQEVCRKWSGCAGLRFIPEDERRTLSVGCSHLYELTERLCKHRSCGVGEGRSQASLLRRVSVGCMHGRCSCSHVCKEWEY